MKSGLLGVITVPLVRNVFQNAIIFRHFRIIAKEKHYQLRHVCLFVRPHGTTLLITGRIFMKFEISVFLQKLMKELSFLPNLTKITVVCMKAVIRLWTYLTQVFVENGIFLKNVNKFPTRCNSMQIFIYCKVILHVSGVTAPIIRSTKNCNRSLRYRS